MTETEQQTEPTAPADGETEPSPKFHVSMSVSIEQPDTATRSTGATVFDADDLAEEILRAAGGLAQVAQVGDDFRRLTDQCLHMVQVVHKAHPDEVTAAAEQADAVARVLDAGGFGAIGQEASTLNLAMVVERIIRQRNAKQAVISATGRELAPALRGGDPDEVAAAAGYVAQRLMDYRTNLTEVLDPEVASSDDSEIIRQAVAKLGILGDVNGDQVGPARAAYLGAADAMGKLDVALGNNADIVSAHEVRPLLDAVKALGVLLDMRVVESRPDPVPARD